MRTSEGVFIPSYFLDIAFSPYPPQKQIAYNIYKVLKMKPYSTCILTAFLLIIPTPLSIAENELEIDEIYLEDAAALFAPIFVADRYRGDTGDKCKYNIPALASFDGNWNPLDNEDSYEKLTEEHPELIDRPSKFLQRGILNIYYEAIASETHVFLTYYLFYPHDAGDECQFEKATDPGGHLNDASSVMLIVGDDGLSRELEWIIVQDHGEADYIPAHRVSLVIDKPLIKIKTGTHQMRPILVTDDLPDMEDHYLFGLDDNYRLVPIFPTLWAERNNHTLFCRFVRGIGVRYCDEIQKAKGRGTPPWAPWAREFRPGGVSPLIFFKNKGVAESYVDPIRAFESLYETSDEVYSDTYLYNPYLPYR